MPLEQTNELDIAIPNLSVHRCLYLSKILFRFSPPGGRGGTTFSGTVEFLEDFILVVLLKIGDGGLALEMEMEP